MEEKEVWESCEFHTRKERRTKSIVRVVYCIEHNVITGHLFGVV